MRKDILSSTLVILGAVVVFAKLQAYSWWLIGSYKGALGVLAVIGVGILLTNIIELVQLKSLPSFGETFMWLVAATIVIASLAVTTTKAEFVAAAIAIGVTWLAQVADHAWSSTHHEHHYLPT